MMPTTHHFFATSAGGTESALAVELIELGLDAVAPSSGGVRFRGPLISGIRACLWSRIAARVLLELGHGGAGDSDAFYQGCRRIPWEEHIGPHHTFAVRATLNRSSLNHSGFAALKAKDAIVDRLRDKRGKRPSVDTRRPDLAVSVHVERDRATFYLDLAGDPLHRRGWRASGGEAPLKESLAAAILRIGGYDPSLPLCDPMCGSGTLPIEAALLARKMAPGLVRGFCFERWPSFGVAEREAYRELREQAKAAALAAAPAPLLAFDRSPDATALTERNSRRAKVRADLSIDLRDARDPLDLPEGSQLFVNPPYGERLGKKRLQLEGLYRQLGERWFSTTGISRICILSANPRIEACLGRPPDARTELFNGPLRAFLLTYLLDTV